MGDRIQAVELPDGTKVWVRMSALDWETEGGAGTGTYASDYDDVGVWDSVTAKIEGMRETIEGVARSVRDATRRSAPDETSVTFGLEVVAKPGKAIALLADGEVKTNISVTLTWQNGDRAGREDGADAADPAARAESAPSSARAQPAPSSVDAEPGGRAGL
ncbi:CU044_2847 family protein [Streptomyces sp. NPDC050504]|uniref:CU044_2847 family protein n=1 Tax=Streptomyces sp. NPDC050504 TaxID=3365618 RepID=UPI0037B7A5BA